MNFKILKKSRKSWGRVGILKTSHGEIQTPAFVPVATQAALKGMLPDQANESGTQILMVNTYHLWVRGVVETVKSFGGLHQFMHWQKPLMTDSGGFQIFSLGFAYGKQISKIVKNENITFLNGRPKNDDNGVKTLVIIDEEGVTFRSHIDGSVKRLAPRISIGIQESLGADIIFTFDECASPTASYVYTKQSLARTHRWAKESLKAKKRTDQLLFGIVQGGRFKDLRQESAKFIASLPFEGIGIGGGFDKKDITTALEWVIPLLPDERPRHFLGIGEIDDIKESVKRGIDLFDCVIPTRLARHGVLVTAKGRVTISQAKWRTDKNPPEKGCTCYTCQHFSRAYLCHLSRAKEILAIQLANIHNVFFYNQLMEKIREDTKNGKM